MKRIAFALSLALGLAALAFAAGLLVTQRRVARAVELLRQEHLYSTQPGSYHEILGVASAAAIDRLGCRALPALMDELDPELSPYYLCRVSDCLMDVSDGHSPRVVFGEDPAERRKSIDVLRAWYAESGRFRHVWWKFWSSNCVQ